MSLLEIFATYTKLSSYKFESEDDDHFVDKIFRKFSSIMMVIFSVMLGVYQLVGKPIQCWCNNEHDVGKRCDYAKLVFLFDIKGWSIFIDFEKVLNCHPCNLF